MTPWASSDQLGTSTAERPLLSRRYEILGLIGSGGMGTVYRALDRELDEVVALKMLRQGLVATPRLLERFRREVKLARRVTHVNVARTFDIGEHEGDKFLTMEYVDGESLSAVLAREGPLPPARVSSVLSAICAGLAAAHAAGVVHRDLKPDNVLVAADGRVVITDFGVACVRADAASDGTLGGVVGTPAYMAPEQVEGKRDIDARADIYALGVMMFEMLTAKMPFGGETPFTVATARLDRPPPDPRAYVGVPQGLAEITLRCMARVREQRFGSALELQSALAAVAPTLDQAAPRATSASVWRAPEPQPSADEGERTLAVLPFRNSGPSDDEYLADGLTEDLIDTLSMTKGLRVRPRAVVMPFKGREGDPRELGRELSVDVVVDASLRRLGESLRITVRLLGVADGFQLWAKRFDGSAGNLLAVCDEAAAAIAEALSTSTRQSQRQALTSPEAVELYLQGRALYRGLWRGAMQRAVAAFGEAHRLAPQDPTILSAYARAQARLWFQAGAASEGGLARELAERALTVAPERGESWLALASVRFVELDLPVAARHLRQALSRSPQLPEAHELLGDLLMEVGELDTAIERHRTASLLDPTLRNRFTVARALGLRGQFDDALRTMESQTAEDEYAALAGAALATRLLLWQPRRDSYAVPHAGDDSSVSPIHYMDLVRRTVEAGKLPPSVAREIDEQFIRPGEAPRFVAFKHQLATEIMAWTQELECAEDHLRRAVEVGLSDKNWLALCPVIAPLRQRPGFSSLSAAVDERAAAALVALEGD